jgi:putative transposase
MGRSPRAAEGGQVYHALNRSNGRMTIFEDEGDYAAFERVLSEAVKRYDMRLLSYCIMPNHFHLVVWPCGDGDLSRFMRWLTLTHTQRWHAQRGTAGSGHVYQGRFKSFPVQDDGHLVTVCRYVERNPLKAGLVARAEEWCWGSLWRQVPSRKLTDDEIPALSLWPVERPAGWVRRVNTPLRPSEEEAMKRSLERGQPFGDPEWQSQTAARLGLESTFRPRGRPRSPEKGT